MPSRTTSLFLVFVATATLHLAGFANAEPATATATGGDAVAPEVIASGELSTDSFESSLDTTGFVDVIDASDAWRGYRTVGDILENSVGIRVRHFGAREDSSTISVRGSTASQVKILIDGVAMNRADDAVVDLADLPVDIIERIEVYRGFTPVRFASSGASSVINIVTRSFDTSRSSASLSLGSFKTGKISMEASEPTDDGALNGFFTFRRTAGDFEFSDDNNTPQNPFDDTRTNRQNNDLESWNLLLRYRGNDSGTGRSTITGNTYYKDEGAPGFDVPQSLASRFRQWRSSLSAAWEHADGYRAQLDGIVIDETLDDPTTIGSSGVDASLGFPYQSADSLTLATTLQLGASRTVGKRHFVEASMEAAFEHIEEQFDVTSGTQSEAQARTRVAIAVGDEIYFSQTRLSAAPQLRYESIWNRLDLDGLPGTPISSGDLPPEHDDSLDPRLGLRWDATPQLAFKANASTYFRPPNFGELFGDSGFSVANAELGAEKGKSADVGLLARYGDIATLEYAYFVNDIDDMIVFLSSGGAIPRPQNIGEARIQGHELRLQLEHRLGLTLDANLTLQDPENRTPFPETNGKQLPSVPEHEGYLLLAADRHRWRAEYEMDYRSDSFFDPQNDDRTPSRFLHTLRLIWKPVPADFRIELEARNLSDEQSLDVVGFVVPGRAFFVTFSYGSQPAPKRTSDNDE